REIKVRTQPKGVISQKPYLISFSAFRVGTGRTLGILVKSFAGVKRPAVLVRQRVKYSGLRKINQSHL
ncbi:hypothetical protein, partial [Acaryochloris sp. IP29b_bin.137]|uniref:hypothetical protein n=1 Tax=Acaryochloris sp. IP29b_bin.137 TaxID=2969217 RepID=UPI00263A357D